MAIQLVFDDPDAMTRAAREIARLTEMTIDPGIEGAVAWIESIVGMFGCRLIGAALLDAVELRAVLSLPASRLPTPRAATEAAPL